MATTFTTTINAMYTLPNVPNLPEYVINTLFTVSGTDGTHTASIDGNLQFTVDTNQPNYVPYAQLTQAEVLGWITASGQLPNLEACVLGQLNSLANPPVSPSNTALPWVTLTSTAS